MGGRTPYLADGIWSLFPDRLDEEGKPEGWVNSTIGQEVDVVGGSPSGRLNGRRLTSFRQWHPMTMRRIF